MEKHKKLVRVVCLVLAALMVMTIGVPLIFAYAETPAEKLERLRKELEDIKSNISAVENSKEKSEQTKQYYQAQANNLKAQLAAIKEDIAAQQQSIELKNAEVAEKAANVAYNKSMFESRLKGMYEMSRQSNLAILLGIDDVSQMLLFAENLQQISEHDTQLVQQLRDEQAALEAQRAELEQQLADLAAREQELTDTAVAYSNAIQQADAAISAAEADLAANEEALAETQRQYEQAQEEWRQWTAANNVDFEYNQGGFAWPIPGYTNLSSDFGVGRWIYGKWDVHRGMDVPAPAGTPIYAADNGIVTFSGRGTGYNWSYKNLCGCGRRGEHQQPLDLRNFRKDIPRLRPCYHLRPYVGARCKRRRLRDAGPAHRLCGEHGQQYGQPPAF